MDVMQHKKEHGKDEGNGVLRGNGMTLEKQKGYFDE